MAGHTLTFSFFTMLLLALAFIGGSLLLAWLIIRHLSRHERKSST